MAWKPKFAELTSKTHSEQGIWFLNGFWEDGLKDKPEEIWGIVHKFIECQIDGPVLYGSKKQVIEEAADLDEFKSHRILEMMGNTMTVVELRKHLSALDIDKNNKMCVSEYLLDKYKKTPDALVNSPQGDVDPVKLAAATKACDDASEALSKASDEAEAAAASLKAATAAEAAAAKDAAAAKAAKEVADAAQKEAEAAEAIVKAAEAELQAAIDEITALEKAKEEKVAACQAIIDDPATGAVKKGKAVQEKEQTLAEDPLPLRKAKITQGAALKKVTKVRIEAEEVTAKATAAAKAAADAKAQADASHSAAEQAAKDAAAAKVKADAAAAAAEAALAAAQAALDDLKSKGTGSPQGKLWWMERVLTEKKKYGGKR